MSGAARLPEGSFLTLPGVRRVLELLEADGERAFVVGGAVRNALIGRAPGDIDIATTARPEAVMRRARAAGLRAVPTGLEHGTVTVVVEHVPYEVTTLRRDVETDGRRAVVAFSRDIAEDAARRDFTMNALYVTPDGTVLDPVGGLPDLAARRVRFIGSAETRIREDYLRILRLFRFHADYGEGDLDPQARDASVRLRAGIGRLSAERVRAEWLKLLMARRGPEILAEVAETGFADRVLGSPARVGLLQRLVDGVPEADAALRFAASSLHGASDAERLAQRLRLSRAEAGRLSLVGTWMDRLHGRAAEMRPDSARSLAYDLGAGPARDVLAVAAAADGLAVTPFLDRLSEAVEAPFPRSPFNGAGLVALGVAPGPTMGRILAEAERAWKEAGFPVEDSACKAILGAAMARVLGSPEEG